MSRVNNFPAVTGPSGGQKPGWLRQNLGVSPGSHEKTGKCKEKKFLSRGKREEGDERREKKPLDEARTRYYGGVGFGRMARTRAEGGL